jgi:hypothetical protein
MTVTIRKTAFAFATEKDAEWFFEAVVDYVADHYPPDTYYGADPPVIERSQYVVRANVAKRHSLELRQLSTKYDPIPLNGPLDDREMMYRAPTVGCAQLFKDAINETYPGPQEEPMTAVVDVSDEVCVVQWPDYLTRREWRNAIDKIAAGYGCMFIKYYSS